MAKFVDLVGKRFTRLTVVSRAENRITSSGRSLVRFNCICDCGRTVTVDAGSLKSGNTRSCGCLWEESIRKTKNRKQNEYIIHEGYIEGVLCNGASFYVDLDDFDNVKDYSWHIGTREGYVTARICGTKHKYILLHRLVMNAPEGFDVDHINHDPLDNRKINLRVVSHQKNMMNVSLRKNNTSGCVGVHYSNNPTKVKKWSAFIAINKKCVHLGSYYTFEEARDVRKAAEKKFYGSYSYDNSMRMVAPPVHEAVQSMKSNEDDESLINVSIEAKEIDKKDDGLAMTSASAVDPDTITVSTTPVHS